MLLGFLPLHIHGMAVMKTHLELLMLHLLPFPDEDTPFTTPTPPRHPLTMNNSREEEIKIGAGLSTGENDSSNCSTYSTTRRVVQFSKLLIYCNYNSGKKCVSDNLQLQSACVFGSC